MRVLVTFAVHAEFAPWKKISQFRALTPLKGRSRWYGSRDIYEGKLGEARIRVLITGMGWWNAGRAVEMSYQSFVPELCISTGFAGSLRPEHRPGDLLVAREVRELRGTRKMRSDPALVEAAVNHGARVVDCFLGSKRVIQTSEDKKRLGAWGAAVEMESFRVMAAAFGRGIPVVAIRGISDAFETTLPYDFQKAADRTGRFRISSLLGQVVRQPMGLPGLIQLGRNSSRTAEKLATFLNEFVGALAAAGFTEKSVQAAV